MPLHTGLQTEGFTEIKTSVGMKNVKTIPAGKEPSISARCRLALSGMARAVRRQQKRRANTSEYRVPVAGLDGREHGAESTRSLQLPSLQPLAAVPGMER